MAVGATGDPEDTKGAAGPEQTEADQTDEGRRQTAAAT
jgi:hypothetical protein